MENNEIKLYFQLCSSLPDRLMCSIYRVDDFGVGWRDAKLIGAYLNDKTGHELDFENDLCIDALWKVKPYLKPINTLSVKDMEDLVEYIGQPVTYDFPYNFKTIYPADLKTSVKITEWFIKNKYDIYGLIESGDALPAKENMYK